MAVKTFSGGDLFVAANWNGGTLPIAGDTATLNGDAVVNSGTFTLNCLSLDLNGHQVSFVANCTVTWNCNVLNWGNIGGADTGNSIALTVNGNVTGSSWFSGTYTTDTINIHINGSMVFTGSTPASGDSILDIETTIAGQLLSVTQGITVNYTGTDTTINAVRLGNSDSGTDSWTINANILAYGCARGIILESGAGTGVTIVGNLTAYISVTNSNGYTAVEISQDLAAGDTLTGNILGDAQYGSGVVIENNDYGSGSANIVGNVTGISRNGPGNVPNNPIAGVVIYSPTGASATPTQIKGTSLDANGVGVFLAEANPCCVQLDPTSHGAYCDCFVWSNTYLNPNSTSLYGSLNGLMLIRCASDVSFNGFVNNGTIQAVADGQLAQANINVSGSSITNNGVFNNQYGAMTFTISTFTDKGRYIDYFNPASLTKLKWVGPYKIGGTHIGPFAVSTKNVGPWRIRANTSQNVNTYSFGRYSLCNNGANIGPFALGFKNPVTGV